MKAVAEHKAPVSKMDRINFEILLSKSLLHRRVIVLFVEINCVHSFRQEDKVSSRKVRAK